MILTNTMNTDNLILTPYNDPFFYETLYSAPLTNNRKSNFYIVNSDNLLLENVSEERFFEYVESQELDYVEDSWNNINDYYNPPEINEEN